MAFNDVQMTEGKLDIPLSKFEQMVKDGQFVADPKRENVFSRNLKRKPALFAQYNEFLDGLGPYTISIQGDRVLISK